MCIWGESQWSRLFRDIVFRLLVLRRRVVCAIERCLRRVSLPGCSFACRSDEGFSERMLIGRDKWVRWGLVDRCPC